MHLLEDSRQQRSKHELKNEYWRQAGCSVIRSALPFGDYCEVPRVVVDTKRDIYEIAHNIDQQHDRFRRECQKARAHGCQLVILVENLDGVSTLDDLSTWRESDRHYEMRGGSRRIEGKRLCAAMRTMSQRYGVRFEFCSPNEAGRRVLEILGEAHNDRS